MFSFDILNTRIDVKLEKSTEKDTDCMSLKLGASFHLILISNSKLKSQL